MASTIFPELLEVRPFRPEDADCLAEMAAQIVHSSFRAAYGNRYAIQIARRLSAAGFLARARERNVYVVAHEGLPVATGSLLGNWVKAVFVAQALQRRGIGRHLMGVLEAVATVCDEPRLWLDATPGAEIFYRRLGWKRHARIAIGSGYAVRMSKRLRGGL